ncbi:MAG: transcriptional regulator NrdR [Candidatus Omnitrophica bacterium]|nr:transcriptional regulator NrdR [Candidatus Omnitrophota bacterium]
MRCPYCKKENDRVIDSRSANEGTVIRRRRICDSCRRRFTTYERIEETPLLIVKRDQRRETYDRSKVLAGIMKACEKRPIPIEEQEAIVDRLEKKLGEKYDKEVPSTEIGEFIMHQLSKVDEVAYVRFASVYRQFKDISHFMRELKELKSLLSKH